MSSELCYQRRAIAKNSALLHNKGKCQYYRRRPLIFGYVYLYESCWFNHDKKEHAFSQRINLANNTDICKLALLLYLKKILINSYNGSQIISIFSYALNNDLVLDLNPNSHLSIYNRNGSYTVELLTIFLG